ncbi:uncharacterized protein VTP21DRAFT_8163 [Calcarisporiella thermophila]|uniref:uncharacterized protein n=1 Tax=Calcarisporiella thermophila TaxID=911321 RepID=UPI003742BE10
MEIYEYTLNTISLLSGLAMVLMVFYYRYAQPNITNSTSFKLSLWIGLNTLLSYSFTLLSTRIGKSDSGTRGFFIRIVQGSEVLFETWTALLVACIAFDLQLSFIHRIKNFHWIQRLYVPLTFVVVFIPYLVSLLSPIEFTEDGKSGDNSSKQAQFFFLSSVFVSLAIGLLSSCYSLLVVAMVIFRVIGEFWWMKNPELTGQNITDEHKQRERRLISFVFRILLYPIVFIATRLFVWSCAFLNGFLFSLHFEAEKDTNDVKDMKEMMAIWEEIPGVKFLEISGKSVSASIGFFNLLILLLNPVLQRAEKHSALRQSWLPLMSQYDSNIPSEDATYKTSSHELQAQK